MGYRYTTLGQEPWRKQAAAEWFSGKWRVPKEAYLACMDACLSGETEYDWFLCLEGERIVGGLGVIENDFHHRKDLAPNVCAVYTEPDCRGRGIAGRLLGMAVEEMRGRGISPPVPADGPYRVLRAVRLGIPVHGPGGRGAGAQPPVRPPVTPLYGA